MDQRLKLHEVLVTLLGSRHVYFQPPANVQMEFPAIVYALDDMDAQFAGNGKYRFTKRWLVTVIDRDPDSPTPDKVARLPLSAFNRRYVVENLNHTVFNLFF